MSPSAPEASVIIPAHDAGGVLRACLESVFRTEGVRYEVILVDDASGDDTGAIAAEFPCRLISVADNIMAANCRNLGARHARGEILVFFDADELVQPDTVRRFVEVLRDHPDVDAVVGSLAPDTPEPGFFSRLKNFQHHFTHQHAEAEGATLDSGRMAIRARVFRDLGGFEPAFSGASIEDIALGYRMTREGHRIRFEPSIQVIHLKGYTLGEMVRSDVLNRAIPWTALMLRERIFRNDLNTRGGNVLSVALAWLWPPALMIALAGRPAGWIVAAGAVIAIQALNAGFLGAGLRRFGWGFALRTAAFLPFMYLYHGAGLLAGIGAYALGSSAAADREPPEPEYRLIEPDAPTRDPDREPRPPERQA